MSKFDAHMTRAQIVETLNNLRQVWHGTPEATEAIIDATYTFAHALGLKNDHRDKFFEECGWEKIWSWGNEGTTRR
jgi:hypothetical protein